MRTRRERIRRMLAATAIAIAAVLAVLLIAGDVLLGRIKVTDGRSLLTGGEWHAAGRWIWVETGDVTPSGAPAARSPAFGVPTPDLYFAVRNPDTGLDLQRSRWTPAGYAAPEPLFELNTAADETDPLVIDGGTALVFATDRPGGLGGFDLWTSRRTGEGFAAAEPLSAPLNSANDDRQPACDAAGLRWVLASNRLAEDGVRLELFETIRTGAAFSPPQLIQTLVTDDGGEARAPALSPDGRLLVFASDRKGGRGSYDLWRSLAFEGAWRSAELIDDLAGDLDETDPAFSAEGTKLVFVRSPPAGTAGPSSLIVAERRELFRLREDDGGLLEKILAILAAILLALLSTWLYLRWGRMHPFIKFIIISMIVHLLVLLYLHTRPKEVFIEGGGGDRAFKVSFAGSDAGAAVAGGSAAGDPTGDKVSADRVGSVAPETAFAPRTPAAPSANVPDASAELGARDVEVAEASAPAAVADRSAAAAPEAAAAASPTATEAGAARSGADAAVRGSVGGAQSLESARSEARDGSQPRGVSFRVAPESGDGAGHQTIASRSGGSAPGAESLATPTLAHSSGVGRPAVPEVATQAQEGTGREGSDAAVASAVGAPSSTASAERSSPLAGAGAAAGAGPGSGNAPATADVAAPAGSAFRRAAGVSSDEVPAATGSDAIARTAPSPGTGGLAPAARETMPAGPMNTGAGGVIAPLVAAAQGLSPGARKEPSGIGGGPTAAGERPASSVDAGEARTLVAGRDVPGVSTPAALPATRSSAGSPRLAARSTGRASTSAGGGDAPPGRGLPEGEPTTALAASPVTAGRRDVFSFAGPPSRTGAGDAPKTSGRVEVAAASLLRARHGVMPSPVADGTPAVYAQRTGAARVEALKRGGGSDETEAAVLAGLKYLRQKQRQGGGWGAPTGHDKYGDFRIGKSALALLAFLGSGHTHRSDGEFRETVAAGFGFLLRQQQEPSGHFGDSEGYGHGIATYALAEAYAMSKDPDLEAPLRRAVRRILDAQNMDRRGRVRGGWSYYYADPQRSYDRWPRMSVSVWQIMALKSARLGGLEVPDASFDAAREFVLKAHDPDLAAFRYNHDPEWLSGSYPTLPGSNSAALFALQLLGVDREDARYKTAVGFVEDRRPAREWRRHPDREFATMGAGNEYYLYYATLGLFCHGGSEWAAWNREMTDLVVRNQRKDGSWKNASYYADYAGDTDQDRSYTTAMAVLTLEVYYRYFTPLLSAMVPSAAAPENGERPR